MERSRRVLVPMVNQVGPAESYVRLFVPNAVRRRVGYGASVTTLRISDVAGLLGVSDDTVRRWADAGKLPLVRDDSGRQAVEGAALARFSQELAASVDRPPAVDAAVVGESARNRFPGIVTRVVRDGVMAQVEIQAGPHRIVSLMSRESADELGLEPGVIAVASVKSTNVVMELPQQRR